MNVDEIASSFAATFERNGWMWGTGNVLGRVTDGSEVRDAVVEVTVPTAEQIAAAIREIVGTVRANQRTASWGTGRIRVERIEGGMRVLLITQERFLSED